MTEHKRRILQILAITALAVSGFIAAGALAVTGYAEDSTITTTTTTTPDEGCTLTPGYWKTHADPTEKKFDETWLLVGGPDAPFFISGQTWIQVLNEDHSGGNAYYILAFQWIAAQLNQLAGATISGAAAAAFADAEDLLAVNTPSGIGALSGDDPLRQEFISLAGTLDDYNNGVIGPGHCDD